MRMYKTPCVCCIGDPIWNWNVSKTSYLRISSSTGCQTCKNIIAYTLLERTTTVCTVFIIHFIISIWRLHHVYTVFLVNETTVENCVYNDENCITIWWKLHMHDVVQVFNMFVLNLRCRYSYCHIFFPSLSWWHGSINVSISILFRHVWNVCHSVLINVSLSFKTCVKSNSYRRWKRRGKYFYIMGVHENL